MRFPVKPGLIKLVLIAGGVALAAKLVAAKKNQWKDLSEPQVRARVAGNMPDRVPEEKREAVADTVVEKMRNRGLLTDEVAADTEDPVAEDPDTPADDMGQTDVAPST